jgi:16S rRNA (guanine527-N7)-methyltransferase
MPHPPAPGDLAEAAALSAQAALLGVSVDARQAAMLLRLLDELAVWNRAYNLTAVESRGSMITHHLLDSLAASADLVGERIADLGTGAGFPGLPLAILHPECRFTLIEATAKKVRFVAHAARTLELRNVEAVHARVEALRERAPFDTLLARAVASLAALAQLARPLSRPGTRLIAYKGQRPDAELAALPDSWRVLEVRALKVPGLGAERHLVVLEARAAPAASRGA